MWSNRGDFVERGVEAKRFISACRNPLAKSATTNSYLIRLRCHGLRRSRSSGTKCRKENLWQSDIDSPKIQKKIRLRIKSECKGTAFFWHGNGLVRIACGIGPDLVHLPQWLGKARKKVEKNTRSNRSNIGNYAEYDKIYSSYTNYSGYSLYL